MKADCVRTPPIARLAIRLDTPEPRLLVRLFGNPEVRVDGQGLPTTRTRKGLWLLALLALRGGINIDRAWLAGTLWPDSDDSAALRSLRQSLHDLKTTLGSLADCIVSPSARSLRIDLTDVWVDVAEFDRLVDLGDKLALEEAERLYRGPLLEGCAEDWAAPERREREEAFVSALQRLAVLASSTGDHSSAAAYLRRAVDADPFREDLWRALMSARAGSGDSSGAAEAYRELRTLLWREMATQPSEETAAFYKQIRQAALQKSTRAATSSAEARPTLSTTLPSPLTELVGRDQHVREIELQVAKSRLVTLTGTGGIGKTRLAVQAAYNLFAHMADGCCFVELAEARDRFQVMEAIRRALQVPEGDGQTNGTNLIAREIGDRNLLLVLDNCEQVDRVCAELAQALLHSCNGVRLMVTSRHPLDVRGETVWPVPTLALPPARSGMTPKALIEYAAVRLFVERARDVKPGFSLTENNAPEIVEICRRLDGIPLALELAAARVLALSLADISRQLGRSMKLLRARGNASARHGTLTAAFDWSWQLLSPEERAVLARLSVFAGGWMLAAAQSVCAREEIDADSVVALLVGLVEKSLVVVDEREGDMRYRLLEPVRQYARDRLVERSEETAARASHRDCFLSLAEETATKLLGPEQAHWYAVLEEEHDNLRSALRFCIEEAVESGSQESAEKGLRLGSALQQFWRTHGHLREGRQHLTAVLALAGAGRTKARAAALNAAATVAHLQGDYDAARSLYQESLTVRRELGDRRAAAGVLNNLGLMAAELQDYASARPLFEEALSINRQAGNRDWEAVNLGNLGLIAQETGDYGSARELLQESLTLYREVGDTGGMANPLFTLGIVAKRLGDDDSARTYLRESVAISRKIGDRGGIAYCLEAFASLAAASADRDRAARLWGFAALLREEIGSALSPKEQEELDREQALVRSKFGEEGFFLAWSVGGEMALEQAIELALSA